MSQPFKRSFPTQYEVKRLLKETLKDQAHIAKVMGCGESDVSRRFSPNDERKSGIGESFRELCGICDANQEAGRFWKTYYLTLFDGWLASPASRSQDLASLVIAAHKESSEVIEAWAAGKSDHEQRKEIIEAIDALTRQLEGLDRQSGQLREVKGR